MKRTGRIRVLPFSLAILGFVMLILGCYGWFSGVFQAFWAGRTVEMPLGDLQGVAVDSSGNVYCGAQFYRRVQKYDPDSQFLFSLHIDPPGGAFRIRVNENDELEVATLLTNRLYRFSPSGEMLEQRERRSLLRMPEERNNVWNPYPDFGAEGERQCRGPDGSVYRIRSPLLFPSVVKTSPSGEQSTVVSVPFHKWLVMGPFPAFLFWIAAGLLLGGVEYFGKRKMRQPKVGQVSSEAAPSASPEEPSG